MRKSNRGAHTTVVTRGTHAAPDAPDQTVVDAQGPHVGGDQSGGQIGHEAHRALAASAPDQTTSDAHRSRVGGDSFGGYSRSSDAADAPDQHDDETQIARVGGDKSGGQGSNDAQRRAAASAPDQWLVGAQSNNVGGDPSGGHAASDAQYQAAASGVPATMTLEPKHHVRDAVLSIRIAHRRRRYAMKLQQKIDRACESYIRSNYTNWSPDMSDDEKERIRLEVQAHLKRARANEHEDQGLADLVQITDQTRAPIDLIRSQQEKLMAKLAEQLPAFSFVESVKGAAAVSFATIVAECSALNRETGEVTTLDDYPNVAKVWKRLGFAPYDGRAGSSWKREKWRPRALTADEWIANPFSGERYALIIMIAESMFRHQWKGAEKTGGDEGEPTGPYGQVFADRRRLTAVTHPEWSKQHSKRDALRIMMKAYLKDLWVAWQKDNNKAAHLLLKPTGSVPPDAPGQFPSDAQRISAGRVNSKSKAASQRVKPVAVLPPAAPGHEQIDTHREHAGRTTSSKAARHSMKPGIPAAGSARPSGR